MVKDTRAKEMVDGTEHEMEHTTSRKTAAKIAKDHVDEHPHYYKKLKKCFKENKEMKTLHELSAELINRHRQNRDDDEPAVVVSEGHTPWSGRSSDERKADYSKMRRAIKRHDLTHEYSDDHGAYERGRDEKADIESMQKKKVPKSLFRKMWNRNVDKKVRKPDNKMFRIGEETEQEVITEAAVPFYNRNRLPKKKAKPAAAAGGRYVYEENLCELSQNLLMRARNKARTEMIQRRAENNPIATKAQAKPDNGKSDYVAAAIRKRQYDATNRALKRKNSNYKSPEEHAAEQSAKLKNWKSDDEANSGTSSFWKKWKANSYRGPKGTGEPE